MTIRSKLPSSFNFFPIDVSKVTKASGIMESYESPNLCTRKK